MGESKRDYRYYLFDLDGTLTQSGVGIIDGAIRTLAKFGIEVTDRDSMRRFIGPPLRYSFREFFGLSEEETEQAVIYYLDFMKQEGIYRAPLYVGVRETLERLSAGGKKLAVVTTKTKYLAEAVIEYDGIRDFFDTIVGPGTDNRNPEKKNLIREALSNLGVSEEEFDSVLMVGDRFYDIEGAALVGVDAAGALYGYGSREELTDAGATFLIEDIRELQAFLKKM